MPLGKLPPKGGHLTDNIMAEVKALMKKRRKLHLQLLELQEKYDEVFDELATIKSETEMVETEVKDRVRKLYKNGSRRGIFVVYEDDFFRIKSTIKYGRDSIDADELAETHPEAFKFRGLSETSRTIDVDKFRELIEEKKLPKKLETLIHRGDFKTPSITIQDVTKDSFTEEADASNE